MYFRNVLTIFSAQIAYCNPTNPTHKISSKIQADLTQFNLTEPNLTHA